MMLTEDNMTKLVELISFLVLLALATYSSRREENAKRAEFGVGPKPITLSLRMCALHIATLLAFVFRASEVYAAHIAMLAFVAFWLIETFALYFLCTEKVEAQYIECYTRGLRHMSYHLVFEYRYEYDRCRVIPICNSACHWCETLSAGEEVTLYVMPGHPKICMFDKKISWWQIVYSAILVGFAFIGTR